MFAAPVHRFYTVLTTRYCSLVQRYATQKGGQTFPAVAILLLYTPILSTLRFFFVVKYFDKQSDVDAAWAALCDNPKP